MTRSLFYLEKKKAKLKDQIGINNVSSRFKEDIAKQNLQAEQVKEKVLAEINI